ncbi:MAG: response regulator [Spirochaetes bacterium]|nr:response regulator [Spirochaetota bacterium]
MKKIKKKEFYTTSDVAGILHVAVGSVINWVDAGEINAVITPGGHRKIPFKELIKFLETHNYEIPPELVIKKLVYLIDDEKVTHDLFTNIFEALRGYDLRSFYSGTEALVALGQEPPRIIIVDILMPDFDGVQVIKNIKANEKLKSIHIIAISGDISKKDEAINAGANVFLPKPFTMEEFQEALKTEEEAQVV